MLLALPCTRGLAAVAALSAVLMAARPCAADEELRWHDEWPRAVQQEYGVALTLGALLVVVDTMPVEETDWGAVDFDSRARDVLRLRNPAARTATRRISDGLFYGLIAYPLAIDALLVAAPRDEDVAWQLMVVDLETMAVSGLLAVTLEHITGRERPYARYCRREKPDRPEHVGDCTASPPKELFESFPSGHTLMGFTAAGLTCAHHGRLPLYGGGAPDALVCGAALAVGATEGTLRLTSDRHYLSDVIVGASLGFAIGYAMPTGLRYTRGADSRSGSPRPPTSSTTGAYLPFFAGQF